MVGRVVWLGLSWICLTTFGPLYLDLFSTVWLYLVQFSCGLTLSGPFGLFYPVLPWSPIYVYLFVTWVSCLHCLVQWIPFWSGCLAPFNHVWTRFIRLCLVQISGPAWSYLVIFELCFIWCPQWEFLPFLTSLLLSSFNLWSSLNSCQVFGFPLDSLTRFILMLLSSVLQSPDVM